MKGMTATVKNGLAKVDRLNNEIDSKNKKVDHFIKNAVNGLKLRKKVIKEVKKYVR